MKDHSSRFQSPSQQQQLRLVRDCAIPQASQVVSLFPLLPVAYSYPDTLMTKTPSRTPKRLRSLFLVHGTMKTVVFGRRSLATVSGGVQLILLQASQVHALG